MGQSVKACRQRNTLYIKAVEIEADTNAEVLADVVRPTAALGTTFVHTGRPPHRGRWSSRL